MASLMPTSHIKRQASRSLEERVLQDQLDFADDTVQSHSKSKGIVRKSSSGQLLFLEALGVDAESPANPTFQNRKVLKVKGSSLNKMDSNGSQTIGDADMLITPQRSSSNNSLSGNLNLSLGQNSFIGLDVDGVDGTGAERTNEANDDGDDFLSNLDSAFEALENYQGHDEAGNLSKRSSIESLNLTNSSYRSISNSSNGRDDSERPLPRTFSNSSSVNGGMGVFRQDSLEVMGLDAEDVEAFGDKSNRSSSYSWGEHGDQLYVSMMDDDELLEKEFQKTSAIVVNSELSDNFGNLMNTTPDPSPRNRDSTRRRSFTEQIKETVGKTVSNLFGTKNKGKAKSSRGSNSRKNAKPRKGRKKLVSKTSAEVKRIHTEAQQKHRDQNAAKLERLKAAIKMTVDFDGKYKTKLGRMTEIDFYTAVIGIANDETDKEVVRRILKKREEHAKRSENQEKKQRIGSNAYGISRNKLVELQKLFVKSLSKSQKRAH